MPSRMTNEDVPSLNPRQLAALKKASPSAADIIDNLDGLNEEIVEQAKASGAKLADPARLDPPKAIQVTPESQVDELAALNEKLEAELRAQQAARAAEADAAAESGQAAPESQEMDIQAQVLQMLKDAPSAPSEAQVAAWKAQHGPGGVQVLAMGEGDVYVFTYLRRKAFQQVQQAIAKASQIEGMTQDPEEMMMEQVLKSCILWPRPLTVEFFYNSRSGVIPTLYNSVMLHSYHLTPQQAMVLTAQL